MISKCINPVCGGETEEGTKFCDPCLTGLSEKRLNIYKMFTWLKREDVGWDRKKTPNESH